MSVLSVRTISLWSIISIYYFISSHVFFEVFITSHTIIDEEFHIPQGLEYCNFIFSRWNPKITTLPGLYIVTALLLGPINLCSIYWLRYISLVFSILNLYLFFICFGIFNKKRFWTNLLSSVNLALLPPLYFFSHVYYTDVVSLTFILLLVIFNKTNHHFLASIFGMFSVIVRQTNIIFVMMMFGEYVLKELVNASNSRSNMEISFKNFNLSALKLQYVNLLKLPSKFFINFSAYLSIAIAFALFVIINGSIVVGDKAAHSASIHLPQLFYFFLFAVVFGWPHFVVLLKEFKKFIFTNRLLTIFLITFMILIVNQNTLEHPYLLADNRHYTFYVWHRFYGFSIFHILLSRHRTQTLLMFMLCITSVVILQKMIEVRYFLVPFILLRFHCNATPWQLFCEFVYFLVVNVVTFHIFFTKNIYWSDFNYAQKLIW